MKDELCVREKLNEVNYKIRLMIDYIKLRQEMRDWHGVEDAASDIRDMEAEKKTLLWVLEEDEEVTI